MRRSAETGEPPRSASIASRARGLPAPSGDRPAVDARLDGSQERRSMCRHERGVPAATSTDRQRLYPDCSDRPTGAPQVVLSSRKEGISIGPILARSARSASEASRRGFAGARGVPGRERKDRVRQRPRRRRRHRHLDDEPRREQPRQPDRQLRGRRLLASWRADGRKIVFMSDRETATNPSGGRPRDLRDERERVEPDADHIQRPRRRVPAWSPDGRGSSSQGTSTRSSARPTTTSSRWRRRTQ